MAPVGPRKPTNDAGAICEAVTRPTMRFVPVKSAERQAALLDHKTREFLVRQRTQVINAIRAHLAEFGIVVPKASIISTACSPPPRRRPKRPGPGSRCWRISCATRAIGSRP